MVLAVFQESVQEHVKPLEAQASLLPHLSGKIHKAMGREIDSTSWWELMQSFITRDELQKGEDLEPLCNLPHPSSQWQCKEQIFLFQISTLYATPQ